MAIIGIALSTLFFIVGMGLLTVDPIMGGIGMAVALVLLLCSYWLVADE